jgi:hypothetical protein
VLIVRDLRGIGRMRIMRKVGIVDYSVSVECEGGGALRGKVGGREEGKEKNGEDRRKKDEK